MKTGITRRDFLKNSSLVIAATALNGELVLFNASPAKAVEDVTFKPVDCQAYSLYLLFQ